MIDVPHLGFIVAAYAFAALTILAMVAATLLDHRALDAKLRALEDARADAAEGRQT